MQFNDDIFIINKQFDGFIQTHNSFSNNIEIFFEFNANIMSQRMPNNNIYIYISSSCLSLLTAFGKILILRFFNDV